MGSLRGFLITGRLGAGKTTVARRLAETYGFQVPTTTTTRTVSSSEYGLCHISEEEFIDEVRAERLRMPMVAGSGYYAWEPDAMHLLRSGTRIAVPVRPYTAIVLGELLDGLCPIWLDVRTDERERRLSLRNEHRDTNPKYAEHRTRFDEQDEAYGGLIGTHLPGAESTADRLSGMYELG